MDGILLLDLLNLGWARIANPRYRIFKAGKKIIEGQAGDKAKGEVKKVTEQFNKE